MPINFRRCPFLVQKEIIQLMSIQESFTLSLISKKARMLVKCCLNFQQLQIQYNLWGSIHSIQIIRKSGIYEFDGMDITSWLPCDEQKGPTWKMFDDDVGVWYRSERFPMVSVNTNDASGSFLKLYQCLLDIFPKAMISLNFFATVGDVITRIMNLVKVNEVSVGGTSDPTTVQAALAECANTRRLQIKIGRYRDVRINPEARFEMDYVYIKDCEWIGKQQLVQNFLNCKQVILPRTSFGCLEDDYPEFVKSWMKGSKMELLKIGGRWIDRNRITDTVGVLPGAVEVRRARVWEDKKGSRVRVFLAGRCYMVQQVDGTRAIVSWSPDEVLLTTKFEVLENN